MYLKITAVGLFKDISCLILKQVSSDPDGIDLYPC